MNQTVHVRAPCRLHFGMLSFGHADRPQFGGVGMMVQPPAVDVRIDPARRFAAVGPLAARANEFAHSAAEHWQLDRLPACAIHVQSPRDHTGLGVGTQLGFAVAAGLRQFLHLPDLSAEALAACVGRGGRSAVGTHGFLHGGLVVDAGKSPGQQLGAMRRRAAVPDEWRIVLVCPRGEQGRAGDWEARAFASLPPVPAETTRELERLIQEVMLPAAQRSDCTSFGEAVYRYGRLAGDCFSTVQGGPFANAAIARIVEAVQAAGVTGVGQSSWGPTVFAITPDQQVAERLAGQLCDKHGVDATDVSIARPDNRGALVELMRERQ